MKYILRRQKSVEIIVDDDDDEGDVEETVKRSSRKHYGEVASPFFDP